MQSILRFLYEWLRRPSWVATVGIVAGLLLFLSGVFWKVPRERIIGIVVMVLSLISGVLLYLYG